MQVGWQSEHGIVYHGKHEEVLPKLEANIIDGLVTDGPYANPNGILGETWDKMDGRRDRPGYEEKDPRNRLIQRLANGVNLKGDLGDMLAFFDFNYQWATECLRIMKPGAWGLAFADGKTDDCLKMALRMAGFRIWATIPWIYTRGNLPHGMDLSKAIDKHLGMEREVIGYKKQSGMKFSQVEGKAAHQGGFNDPSRKQFEITAPASNAANQWEGYNIALKRHQDLIVLFQKPLSEKTYAANILKWGTGGINIGGCLLGEEERWVPDIWTTDEETFPDGIPKYFLVAKASWAEKELGCEHLPLACAGGMEGTKDQSLKTGSGNVRNNQRHNSHPTVKPIELLRYCVRLVRPPTPSPIILDHHLGSGTTAIAAHMEGCYFIGVEMTDAYQPIYTARLDHFVRKGAI